MARQGRVRVYIDADASGLKRGTAAAERSLKDLDSKGTRAMRALGDAAKYAGAAIAAGLVIELGRAVREAREAEKAASQTAAVIKSTGGAAKVTAKHVGELADAISLKAGIDDEAIQASENLLLTFTKVRNEAGKGNKVFDQATQIVTDMSVALGVDAKQAAIQVGKALQDPTIGLTALRRVGVSFTEAEQDKIEALVESGKQLKAQKIILRELKTEFGGSAAAQADPFDKAKVAVENLEEALGKTLMPTLNKALKRMTKFVNEVQRGEGFGGDFIGVVRGIGKAFVWTQEHGLIPFLKGVGYVIKAFVQTGKEGWRQFKRVGQAISNVARHLGGAFKGPWEQVRSLFKTGSDAAIGFVNAIISAINVIPGVDIGHVGGDGPRNNTKGEVSSGGKGKGRKGTTQAFSGARVTTPSAIVGEESPQHPEYVLATNPRYRARNLGLWKAAGRELGVPGFALGGITDAIGGIVSGLNPAKLIDKLPNPGSLPHWMGGLGSFLIGRAKSFIHNQLDGNLGAGGLGRALVPLGRALQAAGFSVSGHSAFGGATPGVHAATSYHYDDRAIDVNWPNARQEPAKLTPLYTALAKTNPVEMYYRNRGIPNARSDHDDHLHLAYAQGGRIGKPSVGSGRVAREFMAVAQRRKATPTQMLALFMAGLTESRLQELNYGDADSLGPLQIRGMHGPAAKRRDATWSANWFFDEMKELGVGGMRDPAALAQAVERSAFPGRYAPNRDLAQQWIAFVGGDAASKAPSLGASFNLKGGSTSSAQLGKMKITGGIGLAGKKQGGGAAPEEDLSGLVDILREQLIESQRLTATLRSQSGPNGVIANALAAVISGQIGGRVGLGFASPSYASGLGRY